MPLVDPIIVSMAVAVTFLIAMLAVVAARPTSGDDLRGADRPPGGGIAGARRALGSD